MKKSTLMLICLSAAFVALGWYLDHPLRIPLLTLAGVSAVLALITALKGNENGKKKD